MKENRKATETKDVRFDFEAFVPYLKKSLADKIKRYDYRKLNEVFNLNTLSEQERGFLSALKDFSNAYFLNKFVGKKYRAGTQADIINYFKNVCDNATKESVYIVFLNAKNKIVDCSKISDGTITQSLLYPREVVAEAIKRGALSVVIVHNHPSGDPTPSENDRKITKKLVFATKQMDMNLLDHIIIGSEGKGYYSFYEDSQIEKYNKDFRFVMEHTERGE